ncbi:hypothetical protein WDU94_008695 [Cyamophila willieti]
MDDDEFESPFKWNIPKQNQYQSDWIVTKPAERLKCMVDDPGFKWCRYGKLLVLIYEHSIRQEKDKAMEYTNQCEAVLTEPGNKSDPFYKSIEKALWHTFLAIKLKISEDHSDKEHVQSVSCMLSVSKNMYIKIQICEEREREREKRERESMETCFNKHSRLNA